jgi:hypothetical protein
MTLGFRPPGQADGLARPCGFVATAVGFRLAQERRDRMGPPPFIIKRDVEPITDADFSRLGSLERLGEDFDQAFDRCSSGVRNLGDELDTLTYENRAQEGHRIDGRGRDLAMADVSQRGGRATLIGQSKQYSPVQRTVGVGLTGLCND